MKKSALTMVLALGITSTSASAFDYFFQTGRSAGYGSAGTTYAHWSAASNYNPALIGSASGDKSKKDFFLVLPNFRGNAATNKTVDEMDDLFTEFEEVNDEFDQRDNIDLLEGDIQDLQDAIDLSNRMVDAVGDIDGLGGNGGFGFGTAAGLSFKKFAVGLHLNTHFAGGGSANVDEEDLALLRRYTKLAQVLKDDVRPLYDSANELEAEANDAALRAEALEDAFNNGTATQEDFQEAQALADSLEIQKNEALALAETAKETQAGIETEFADIFNPDTQSIEFDENDLQSNGRFAGIGWFEVGATIGSKWQLKSGKTVSAGVTLKSVHIELYDYVANVSSIDTGDVNGDDYRAQEDFATADVGVIVGLDPMDKWRIGATVKNISGTTIKSNGLRLPEGVDELTFEVEPQVRVGTSYNGGWYRIAADIDLTESSGPVTSDGEQFFQGTQYANVGAILNAFNFVELRAGYRHNMASSDVVSKNDEASAGLVTLGAGLYLGPIQADLAFQASPDGDEIGFGFQSMLTF
ncbi:MAG: conjugal transfer protein TraF [Gammaproteobacteria bacterium]|nr:conjugal transfer protein TraF [Gammaproteobacteria bacterium]